LKLITVLAALIFLAGAASRLESFIYCDHIYCKGSLNSETVRNKRNEKERDKRDTREEQETAADAMRNDNTHQRISSFRWTDCWTLDSESAHVQ
jgi:hypothetical protein